MSRGAAITLGVACTLCGVAFLLVPGMGVGASVIGMYLIASFCFLIAVACLIPHSRPVTVRIIAAIVLATCTWYVWDVRGAPWWPTKPGQPSLGRALLAFLVFGLPAGYVTIRGAYPWWGRVAQAFGAESIEDVKQESKPIVLSWKRVPSNAKFVLEGFPMERSEWEAIWKQVSERQRTESTQEVSKRRRIIASAGLYVVMPTILGLGVWRHFPPATTAIATVATGIGWYLVWMRPRNDRRAVQWQVMAERGYPICIDCGYNLQGTGASGPCPECGWRRQDPDAPSSSAHS